MQPLSSQVDVVARLSNALPASEAMKGAQRVETCHGPAEEGSQPALTL